MKVPEGITTPSEVVVLKHHEGRQRCCRPSQYRGRYFLDRTKRGTREVSADISCTSFRSRCSWDGFVSPVSCRSDLLAGQGSNLQPPDSKSGVLPVELPAIGPLQPYRCFPPLSPNSRLLQHVDTASFSLSPVSGGIDPASLLRLMGSLIKKRRKRMRKKKHRKLLKRTRVQRRNKK